MSGQFATLAFTPAVQAEQSRRGSRAAYARHTPATLESVQLSAAECDFIARCDSFYQATVSETGWPYVQHRGGPQGFLKVLEADLLAYADFGGNRQYVSVGNLRTNDKISLFIMDYAHRRRLKILGRVSMTDASEADPALLAALSDPDYRAAIERIVHIRVQAVDWNCPQHITPRWSEAQVKETFQVLSQENARLRADNARLQEALRHVRA
ncbi:MAG: pyridoxamine 5'-phosphate oxidase family protein [Burkholderiales bacterium]|nr:pyridoxamine 5'-phosphate oxidase family protein [Burkholderiales bacterium]